MALTRERAVAYRLLLCQGFTETRHNLPPIRGNPAGTRAHHARARVIADRLHWLAAASAEDFRDFDEGAFWHSTEPIDVADVYLRPFCDRSRFEAEARAKGSPAAGRAEEGGRRVHSPTLPPRRMAGYRRMIQAAYGAIRKLLESDPTPHADSFHRRVVETIADRMHNVARFSADDFVGFDEDRFWDHDTGSARLIYPFMPRFDRSTFERDLDQPARPGQFAVVVVSPGLAMPRPR